MDSRALINAAKDGWQKGYTAWSPGGGAMEENQLVTKMAALGPALVGGTLPTAAQILEIEQIVVTDATERLGRTIKHAKLHWQHTASWIVLGLVVRNAQPRIYSLGFWTGGTLVMTPWSMLRPLVAGDLLEQVNRADAISTRARALQKEAREKINEDWRMVAGCAAVAVGLRSLQLFDRGQFLPSMLPTVGIGAGALGTGFVAAHYFHTPLD